MSTTNTTMTMTDFQAKVLMELAYIREHLASPSSSDSSSKKQKKERKPRDPNAKPNDWIVFTGRVRTALKGADLPAGKECQQFASHLKTTHPDAYSMTDDDIVAAHDGWVAPPPKPKASAETSAPVNNDAVPEAKPKRTLSDEQKVKMAAGRKAAAERKKAEKDAASTEVTVAVAVPAPVKTTPPPAPTGSSQPVLRPLPFKGKKYLWDPESNGLWVAEKDGSRGAWAGLLASDRKSINDTAPSPASIDGATV